MSILGDFVKLRREELDLDQVALAQQLGVNQQTVSKWEQAKTLPRPHRIRRLAEVLRVDVTDLMRYAGYLPHGEPTDADADAFDRLLDEVSGLSNDQLILLIDQAWGEYRCRAAAGLPRPRRQAKSVPG